MDAGCDAPVAAQQAVDADDDADVAVDPLVPAVAADAVCVPDGVVDDVRLAVEPSEIARVAAVHHGSFARWRLLLVVAGFGVSLADERRRWADGQLDVRRSPQVARHGCAAAVVVHQFAGFEEQANAERVDLHRCHHRWASLDVGHV